MRRVFTWSLLMLVGVAVTAEASTIPWGPRAGFTLKPDQFVIGGHARVAEPVVGWGIVPNFDLGFGDSITTLQINGDFVYNFPELETYNWGWYAGAGLTWATYWYSGAGSSGEIGLSLLGGVSRIFDNENRISLELRFGIDDIPDFMLTLGYWFF